MSRRQLHYFQLPQIGAMFFHTVPPTFSPRHVGVQSGVPMVWAEVDLNPSPDHDEGPKQICIWAISTGWDVPEGAQYLGTINQEPTGFEAEGVVCHYYWRQS